MLHAMLWLSISLLAVTDYLKYSITYSILGLNLVYTLQFQNKLSHYNYQIICRVDLERAKRTSSYVLLADLTMPLIQRAHKSVPRQ